MQLCFATHIITGESKKKRLGSGIFFSDSKFTRT